MKVNPVFPSQLPGIKFGLIEVSGTEAEADQKVFDAISAGNSDVVSAKQTKIGINNAPNRSFWFTLTGEDARQYDQYCVTQEKFKAGGWVAEPIPDPNGIRARMDQALKAYLLLQE